MSEVPWWVDDWCQRNGWSDPCWVDEPDQMLGGRWWAIPPHGVMPVPIDPLGLDAAFGSFDRAFGGFEQVLDGWLVQLDRQAGPVIERLDGFLDATARAWGIDRLFDDEQF